MKIVRDCRPCQGTNIYVECSNVSGIIRLPTEYPFFDDIPTETIRLRRKTDDDWQTIELRDRIYRICQEYRAKRG